MQLVILAIKARAGNTEAAGRIFNNLAPSIRSYLSYLTGSTVESEDLLQSTFVKALEGFSGLKNAGAVRSWLFSIAFSEYVRWSKVKRHASVPGEEIASELVLGPDAAILYAEIRSLPIDLRAAFVSREIIGLSVGETSRALGIPEGTVKSRCFEARSRLRKRLAAAWPEYAARSEVKNEC